MATGELREIELVLRLGAALVTATVIGLERESHGRAAGLRTTVLVCVAAAMSMILSEGLQGFNAPNWRPDPARLGAGVLTGMGFLGAGSIIRQENVVRGVTTAATLWCVTAIGLAFGSGFFLLGFSGWVLALFALFILPFLEGLIKNDWYATITVHVEMDGPSEEDLRKLIKRSGVKVKNMDIEYDIANRRKTIVYDLKFKKVDLVRTSEFVVHELLQQPGISHVKWK